jgi:hypothetical protein
MSTILYDAGENPVAAWLLDRSTCWCSGESPGRLQTGWGDGHEGLPAYFAENVAGSPVKPWSWSERSSAELLQAPGAN